MADHFERAKDEILLKTEGNGGPSNRDMLRAMGALALDVDEAIDGLDKKQKARHVETLSVLDIQAAEITCSREDITVLEKWRTEQTLTCETRVVARIEKDIAAHEKECEKKRSPRRAADPAAFDFRSRREPLPPLTPTDGFEYPTGDQRTLFEMILGWSIVKWLMTLAVGAVVVWGVSYWASSCAAQRVEQDFIHSGGEVHLAVPSPSPSPNL